MQRIPLFTNVSMPRNVEIKAVVEDGERLKSLAAKLSEGPGTLIIQEDTFFRAPNGRLKLRELQGSPAQLIFYVRSDVEGPKTCDFTITETSNPESLKATLSQALGIRGVVRKRRLLYLVGQTRVHVDEVEGLGSYMELEVCLRNDQTPEEGEVIAKDLMTKFEVSDENLITGAYIDLILKQNAEPE